MKQSRNHAPRRRRLLRRAGLYLAALLLLLVVVASVAVRLPAVRAAALGAASRALEAQTGLVLEAADWQMSFLRRRLVVLDLVLRPRNGGELVAAQRLEIEPRILPLLRGKVRLRRVLVAAPHVDLAVPFPEQPERQEASSGSGIEIARFEVVDASLSAPRLEGAAEEWIDAWRGDGIEASGSLRAGRLELALSKGRIETTGERIGRRRFAVRGQLAAADGGPLHLSGVEVSGAGLQMLADATLALSAEGSRRISVRLDAELATLLEELESGRLEARADFDLATTSGEIEVRGNALPGELAALLIADAPPERLLPLTGTTLDLTARLERAEAGPLRGNLEVSWIRAGVTLLAASAHLDRGEVDDGGHPRLASLGGGARLQATALSAPFVQTLLQAAGLETRTKAEGLVDVVLDLGLEPEASEPFSVAGDVVWRRGGRTLLAARIPALRAGFTAGRLDPLRVRGEVSAQARDLPLDQLMNWLEPPAALRSTLAGTHVDVTAGARLGASDPLQASARLEWHEHGAPLATVSARNVGAAIDADGRLDPTRMGARVELELPGLEVGRLRPWLDPTLPAPWLDRLLVPSRVRGGGTLEVEQGGSRLGPASELRFTWHLGEPGELDDPGGAAAEEVLLEGSLRVLPEPRLVVRAEAALLPASPGERRLGVELEASSWSELREAVLREARLDLELPELAETRADIERRWPDLLPAGLDEWPLRGRLSGSVAASGSLVSPSAELDVTWLPHPGATVKLRGEGEPLARSAEVALTASGLSLAELASEIEASGSLAGSVHLAASGDVWRAEVEASAEALELADLRLDRLQLAAAADADGIHIELLHAAREHRTMMASGNLEAALPPTWAQLQVDLVAPVDPLTEASLGLALSGGVLRLESRRLESAAGSGRLIAVAPLATLARTPGLSTAVQRALTQAATQSTDGAVSVLLWVPELDLHDLASLLGGEDRLTGGSAEDLRLSVAFDPGDPAAANAVLQAAGLELTFAGEGGKPRRLRSDDGFSLHLRNRQLDLAPLVGRLDDDPLELRGSARLSDDWSLDRPPADLLAELALQGRGTIDLALLDPWLLGGVGSGPLEIEATLTGPLDSLDGDVTLRGDGARIDYLTPYVSRLEDPRVRLSLRRGEVAISDGTARLNEGSLQLSGSVGEQGVSLVAQAKEVRYRLDYGLSAVLAADLRLDFPPADAARRSSIRGEMVAERGLVRRDIDLERQLLDSLFAANSLEGAATTGDDVDLDIRLTTREGIRVRNNVADLQAVWSPLSIRGTLAEPRIDGVVDVEPGGLIFAYGQTLRIDRATLTLPALPGAEPQLDLITTSSIEDPSIGRRDGGSSLDPFAARPTDADSADRDRVEALTLGFADYVGNRLAAGVGQIVEGPLGITGLTIRPTVVFNESDPDARLTVGRELTPNLDLALSLNMREAESRTYLLLAHDLAFAPRLEGQVFTKEDSEQGATLQQTFDFGGGPRRPEARLRRIEIVAPDELDTGGLERSLGLEKREPLPDGVLFDGELQVSDWLARRGYYAARVGATTVPARDGRDVDLRITIEPGPRTAVVFAGDRPTPRLRRAISMLYRSDYYQEASLVEIRQQTRQALRSAGHVEPEVDVRIEPGGEEGYAQTLVVEASGGRRLEIGSPRFRGVTPEVQERLAARFPTQLARVELATAEPAADSLVARSLRAFGYPAAAVTGRTLSDNGRELVVDIEPGPRQQITEIELQGVGDEEETRLRSQLQVQPGEPLTVDRIAASAMRLEEDLRQQGFSRARVRAKVRESSPTAAVVVFEIEPGPVTRVNGVDFEGMHTTHQEWARRIVDVEKGDTVDAGSLAEVRRRLFATGLFSSIYADLEPQGEGGVRLEVGVEERPRFRFGYGLRWESEEGGGVVLDFRDNNFTGRGIALGARALATSDLEIGRLFATLPNVLGSRYQVESFAEWRDETTNGLLIDTFEASLQLSRPFGRYGTGRVYGRYRDELFREEDPDPFFPLDDRIRSPFLGVQYLHNRRTDPLSGRKGLFASADLSGTSEVLGSDFRYLRLFAQVNLYRPLGHIGSRRLGWAQSYRVGLAETFDRMLPVDLGFVAGGEYSVRGYGRESLTAGEDLGPAQRLFGGEALLVVNQELHLSLSGRFSGVLFFDAGNVWSQRSEFGSDLATSLGLGLRTESPLGRLRLDVAFPLDRRPDDSAVKVYVGFGQVF